jgi:Spy/CpxP family protein refolding chaperone
MKSIKVLIAALALGVASTPVLQAQEKKGGMTAEQQIARIEEAVGSLTADQKKKIEAIMAKGREEMKNASKEERGGMMKKQRDEIRGVLTPEQQKKYDAMPQGGGKKKKDQ